MRKRELDRQIRKVQRATERIQRKLEALLRAQDGIERQIARQRKRLEGEATRKQRKTKKAREKRQRAAAAARRREKQGRRQKEMESVERDATGRHVAAESRSERTRRLIDLGGLVVIAGLVDISVEDLFAVLSWIPLVETLSDYRESWRKRGRHAMAAWMKTGRNATRPDLRNLPASESPARTIDRFTHRLATLGGVIDKAGLGHEDRIVILGLLVLSADYLAGRDPPAVPPDEVENAAGRPVSRETGESVRLTFPGPIPRPLGVALGELALWYCPEEFRWYGAADRSAVEAIAAPAGGRVESWPHRPRPIRTAHATLPAGLGAAPIYLEKLGNSASVENCRKSTEAR